MLPQKGSNETLKLEIIIIKKKICGIDLFRAKQLLFNHFDSLYHFCLFLSFRFPSSKQKKGLRFSCLEKGALQCYVIISVNTHGFFLMSCVHMYHTVPSYLNLTEIVQ